MHILQLRNEVEPCPPLFVCRRCNTLTFARLSTCGMGQTCSEGCLLSKVPEGSNVADHVQMRHAWTRSAMSIQNAVNELANAEQQVLVIMEAVTHVVSALKNSRSDPEGFTRDVDSLLTRAQDRLERAVKESFRLSMPGSQRAKSGLSSQAVEND